MRLVMENNTSLLFVSFASDRAIIPAMFAWSIVLIAISCMRNKENEQLRMCGHIKWSAGNTDSQYKTQSSIGEETVSDPIAQLVEHSTFNRNVAGSSPAGVTCNFFSEKVLDHTKCWWVMALPKTSGQMVVRQKPEGSHQEIQTIALLLILFKLKKGQTPIISEKVAEIIDRSVNNHFPFWHQNQAIRPKSLAEATKVFVRSRRAGRSWNCRGPNRFRPSTTERAGWLKTRSSRVMWNSWTPKLL